jgi:hypothetical protein
MSFLILRVARLTEHLLLYAMLRSAENTSCFTHAKKLRKANASQAAGR